MLIAPYKERMTRSKHNTATILNFLKQETYSDFKNLMLLLNYKSFQALYPLLNKLIAHQWITKSTHEYQNVKIVLWGITDQGLTQCTESSDTEEFQYFKPANIKTWTMVHHLMNQEVRIYLEHNGWSHWQNADRYTFRKKYPVPHRPDALIIAPNGHTIAIETERTLKTKPRYQEILKSHLLAKKNKYWSKVIYVVPDSKTKIALTNRFNNIVYVNMNGSRITLTDDHRKTFHIFTLEEMKTLVIH